MSSAGDQQKTKTDLIAELDSVRAELRASIAETESFRTGEAALIGARDGALNADRAKNRFLAMLSHELRTPMSPVLMLATLGESNQAIPETVRQDFAIIRRNVELQPWADR